MSKLSGILPANSRILSADISNAQPTRAGAPKFWGGADPMDGSPKSILAASALDRVSWSVAGKQGMNDSLIPQRPDEFQNGLGNALVDFSSGAASFSGASPGRPPEVSSPTDGPSFNPSLDAPISQSEGLKPVSTGRVDFFA